MAYREKKTEKLYYSIGEVSRMLNVNASMIRFWENKFDILKPRKNKKGNRLFTKQDVENIKLIYHLVKERGFKLKSAQQMLHTHMDEVQKTAHIVSSLNRIKHFLLEVKKQLP